MTKFTKFKKILLHIWESPTGKRTIVGHLIFFGMCIPGIIAVIKDIKNETYIMSGPDGKPVEVQETINGPVPVTKEKKCKFKFYIYNEIIYKLIYLLLLVYIY